MWIRNKLGGCLVALSAMLPLGSYASVDLRIYDIDESPRAFITNPSSRYTIQIFGVKKRQLVENKALPVSDKYPVFIYKTVRGQSKAEYFGVSAGLFEGFTAAKDALSDIKRDYPTAWIKPVSKVIADIDRAELGSSTEINAQPRSSDKSTVQTVAKVGEYTLKRAGRAPVEDTKPVISNEEIEKRLAIRDKAIAAKKAQEKQQTIAENERKQRQLKEEEKQSKTGTAIAVNTTTTATPSSNINIEMPAILEQTKSSRMQERTIAKIETPKPIVPEKFDPHKPIVFEIKKGSLEANLRRLFKQANINMVYNVSKVHRFAFNEEIAAANVYVLVDKLVAPHKLTNRATNSSDQVRYKFFSGGNVTFFYESDQYRG
jgi:hypothetical protein